ncbi:MAG: hypothetical protein QM487_10135 [Candidatus Marithrix sp.]
MCTHLPRELNNLTENGSLWAEDMHEFLLSLYKNSNTEQSALSFFLKTEGTSSKVNVVDQNNRLIVVLVI